VDIPYFQALLVQATSLRRSTWRDSRTKQFNDWCTRKKYPSQNSAAVDKYFSL